MSSLISWKPDPDYRGTFDIISSCLSTLGICVWSAIHIDIPKGKTWYRQLVEKFGWLLVGLLAPELLLFIAFNQYVLAARLVRDAENLLHTPPAPPSWVHRCINKVLRRQKDSTDGAYSMDPLYAPSNGAAITRKHPWTLTHGFYAAMGGFVLDSTQAEGYLPAWQSNAVISPSGLQLLMEHDPNLIPDIPAEDILDRSKADGLAKALLVWQVLWFCCNSLNRLAQRMPLSLLEISTIAHGLCTLVTYALWWNKPLNVGQPTVIAGEGCKEIGAWLSMTSIAQRYLLAGLLCFQRTCELQNMLVIDAHNLLTPTRVPSTQTDMLLPVRPTDFSETMLLGAGADSSRQFFVRVDVDIGTRASTRVQNSHANHEMLIVDTSKFQIPVAALTEQRVIFLPRKHLKQTKESSTSPGGKSPLWVLWRSWAIGRAWTIMTTYVFESLPVPWYMYARGIDIDSTCTERWELASKAVQRFSIQIPENHRTDQPSIIPFADLQSSTDTHSIQLANVLRTAIMAAVLSAVYGLPHFIGWTVTFATVVEGLLWRIATLALTGMGVAAGIVMISLVQLAKCLDRDPRFAERQVISLTVMIYIASSAYIVVESFRELFALPPGAFDLPSWTTYWPHFA